jgi:RNA polymerase-binding transcription factor DksA
MRFDPETLARLRKGVMRRGQTLATLLADVLAGKDKARELAAIGLSDRPGLRPAERLRLALEQVETRRKLIDAGDDTYGRCDVCGEDLGLAALDEMPWADRCRAHAGQ